MTRFLAQVALVSCALVAAPILATLPAQAATIQWSQWSSATPGNPNGSASGTIGSNTVTYSGELQSLVLNYPSWGPAGTFSGGSISNPPPQSGNIIQLIGGGGDNATTDTVTFATPITNPVFAIWSLGQSGTIAQFDFNAPFLIQSGGPSNEYAGIPITSIALNVLGQEGNGTIQFIGTYSSISWTNPVAENWYGFTVGAPEVPLPAALPLFASGLGLLGFLAQRRRRKSSNPLITA